MKTHWVQVLNDETAAAVRAAHFIAGRLRRAVEAEGRFRLGLGGAAHAATLRTLAAMRLPFASVEVVEVAAQRPPATNRSDAAALLAARGVQVRALPVDDTDLSVAPNAHQLALTPGLHLVHLAVADDDSDAGGLVEDPLRAFEDRDVAVEGLPHGSARMLLTWRGIARAREVLWVATGAAGALHVARLAAAAPTSPLGRLMAGNVRIIVDRTAAAELEVRSVSGVSFWHRSPDPTGAPATYLAGSDGAAGRPVREEAT